MDILTIYIEQQLLKVLRDKTFNIAKIPIYDGYQRGLASVVYKYFDRKSSNSRQGTRIISDVVSELMQRQQLLEELHKPIIRKYEKPKLYSSFKDNIWGADLADMEVINKRKKGFCFLLCVIDVCSKYTWVVPLIDENGIKIENAFQRILDNSGRKANKIWVNKGGEFCIRSMTSWQQDNDRGTYSTHNEEKCVISERFIRTLKNKIYEHMTSMSKNE